MTIHKLSNLITFLIFKKSLATSLPHPFHPRASWGSIAYENRYLTNPLVIEFRFKSLMHVFSVQSLSFNFYCFWWLFFFNFSNELSSRVNFSYKTFSHLKCTNLSLFGAKKEMLFKLYVVVFLLGLYVMNCLTADNQYLQWIKY